MNLIRAGPQEQSVASEQTHQDTNVEPASIEQAEVEPAKKPSGESRRSFLAKLGFGAAALALAAGPLGGLARIRGGKADADDLPGEDSIFHPVTDPRLDPRRNGRS